MTNAVTVVLMTEAEAKAAIREMREGLEAGISWLRRANETCERFDAGEGWRQLGYRSLAACLAMELQVTRQRAYDLITQMRAAVLIEERTGEKATPSRNEARRIVAGSVAAATESDHLPAAQATSEPVARVPFHDGSSAASEFGVDEGAAVYKCRHCGREGALADLTRCMELIRDEQEPF